MQKEVAFAFFTIAVSCVAVIAAWAQRGMEVPTGGRDIAIPQTHGGLGRHPVPTRAPLAFYTALLDYSLIITSSGARSFPHSSCTLAFTTSATMISPISWFTEA